MAYTFKDRCMNATTTTGTGTLTLGSAVTGFQSISAIGDGNSSTFVAYEVDGSGVPDGGWEVFVGTFTTSGTTLSRQTILSSSNSGSAVDWAAGDKYVACIGPDATTALPDIAVCNGRLTLTTGVPVTTSDVTASTSVYFTPYNGNRIALFNGYSWQVLTFAELSLSTTGLTAGKPYDVFAYISSGAVAIEALVWTNDSTRATGLTTQDGIYVKSGATTRRYIGTFYTFDNSSTVSARDTIAFRHVWNLHNQVARPMRVTATDDSWTYSTATWRQAGGNAANQLDVVFGLDAPVDLAVHVGADAPAYVLAIGDGGTTPMTETLGRNHTVSYSGMNTFVRTTAAAGRHAYLWLEKVNTGTATVYGDVDENWRSGIGGWTWA